jgi:hypothetical protein
VVGLVGRSDHLGVAGVGILHDSRTGAAVREQGGAGSAALSRAGHLAVARARLEKLVSPEVTER